MKTIYSFTETSGAFPGFVEIREENGRLFVVSKTRGSVSKSMSEINRDELDLMYRSIGNFLGKAEQKAPEIVLKRFKGAR